MINKEKASMALDRLNEQMAPFSGQLNADQIVVTLRTVTGGPDEGASVVTADASVRVHFHVTSTDAPKNPPKAFR